MFVKGFGIPPGCETRYQYKVIIITSVAINPPWQLYQVNNTFHSFFFKASEGWAMETGSARLWLQCHPLHFCLLAKGWWEQSMDHNLSSSRRIGFLHTISLSYFVHISLFWITSCSETILSIFLGEHCILSSIMEFKVVYIKHPSSSLLTSQPCLVCWLYPAPSSHT